MSSIVVADGAHFDGFEVTDSEATPAPGSGDTRIMEVISVATMLNSRMRLGQSTKRASVMIGRPSISNRTEPRIVAGR